MEESCSRVSYIWKWYLYATATCEKSSGESLLSMIDWLLCLVSNTIRLVPIHFYGWVMAKWLGRSTQQRVAELPQIMGSAVRYWHPAHGAIGSQLEFTMLLVHGGMFSCLFHTQIIHIYKTWHDYRAMLIFQIITYYIYICVCVVWVNISNVTGIYVLV